MRTLWLCLLIALMPLRLWAGSAMLVEHAAAPVGATVQALAADHPCHTPPALAQVPHALHIDHAHAPDGASQPDTKHLSCTACDLCHTVAHPLVTAWLALQVAPQPPPAHRAAAPANARLAPAFKPPIA